MKPRTRSWVTWIGWAAALAAARTPAAQTTGTVDVGVSTVRYDGFLPSGAASFTPTVQWEGPGGARISARGTYLRFESGNRSLQGLVTGSLFTLAAHSWRGQFSAAAGASSYADFASFWHAVTEARIHLLDANRGAWIGATGGAASFGAGRRSVGVAAIGAWARRSGITLLVSLSRALIGDTAYSDLESTARTQRGALQLEGTIGARVWSRGGGHGLYGEGSAALTLGERTALVVSGGRYPTDPISGSIAGRYLTVAFRVAVASVRPLTARDPAAFVPPPNNSNGEASESSARLEVVPQEAGAVRLIVHAPLAARVEIAGDFSDWQPIPLALAAPGIWETVQRMTSGIHRIDVRLDGMEWIAPTGATRAADDYGRDVAIFVVP